MREQLAASQNRGPTHITEKVENNPSPKANHMHVYKYIYAAVFPKPILATSSHAFVTCAGWLKNGE